MRAGRRPTSFCCGCRNPADQPAPQPPQSTQYVSAETTGYDALDRYGRWETLPDAGPVWFPTTVPDDWAPYRFGHWDSIAPWGWTWIDDQPWGFAPFHYGRWVNLDGHWGWVPGGVVPHPVYAPALVAFVDAPGDPGGGPDGGPGGGPPVGWFPLGPDDAYVPWYAAGPAYIDQVNAVERGHFREFAGHDHGGRGPETWRDEYFNRRYATVVSREAFANAHRVDRAMMRVPAERLEHAAVMRGGPRVVPAAMRVPAGPGGHGEPFRAMPASAGEGALRNRPGGGDPTARREPGGARENPGAMVGRGEGRPQSVRPRGSRACRGRGLSRRRRSNSAAGKTAAARPRPIAAGAQQFGRGRSRPSSGRGISRRRPAIRPTASVSERRASGLPRRRPQQFGRPQAFQNAALRDIAAARRSNSAGRKRFRTPRLRAIAAARSNSAARRHSRPRRRPIAAGWAPRRAAGRGPAGGDRSPAGGCAHGRRRRSGASQIVPRVAVAGPRRGWPPRGGSLGLSG